MPAIGEAQYKAAYTIARDVKSGKLTEYQAALLLVDAGMSTGSAYDYIRVLMLMLDGKRYTRTINDAATRHYLGQIAQDFGDAGLANALRALNGHIEYYERVASKRPSLEAIAREFAIVLQSLQ